MSEPPEQGAFACEDRFLVRVPALPYSRAARLRHAELTTDDAPEAYLAQLRRIVGDPWVAEAITLASPVVAEAVARELSRPGTPRRTADLRRLCVSMSRYVLRMSHRPTPFGLLAGVGTGTFAEQPSATMGTDHRALTRPDRGWLAGVIRMLERDPAVLIRVRLHTNALVTVRAGSVRVTRDSGGGGRTESRLPYLPAVRHLLEHALEPVPYQELRETATAALPGESAPSVDRLIGLLVANGFLVTDLWAAVVSPDPVGQLCDRLLPVDKSAIARDVLSALVPLRDVGPTAPARAATVLASIASRMTSLSPGRHPLHTDLVMAMRVNLPRSVQADLEAAATVLWRLSPGPAGARSLRSYHRDFLDRYGMQRLVPVTDLLDPVRGLGVPAAYRQPGDTDPGTGSGAQRHLAELLLRAVADRSREVELTTDDVTRLAAGGSDGAAPPSVEVFAQVIAESVEELARGDYRLVLSGKTGAAGAGAASGRFGHLPTIDVARPDDLVARLRAVEPDAVAVQLLGVPEPYRRANLAAGPWWPADRVDINVGLSGGIPLSDLLVGADGGRLFLLSRSRGREVVPVSTHMLNPEALGVDVLRFLTDLATEGTKPLRPWTWGSLATAPFLPRVRVGRVVLQSATWQPGPGLSGPVSSYEAWRAEFAQWRRSWGMPDRVLVGAMDNRIPLNLSRDFDLYLLWEECRRRTEMSIVELPGGEDRADGWLRGADGAHAAEIVAGMWRRTSGPARVTRPAPVPADAGSYHVVGGEWLTAKLYTPEDAQVELLHDHLRPRLAELLETTAADRWFYLRYRDPRHHVRLRLHGKPADLAARALPALHELGTSLRALGLLAELTVDGFEAETWRFGGEGLASLVETVFAADSEYTMELLAVSTAKVADLRRPRVLLALSLLDLVDGLLGNSDARRWWLATRRPHPELADRLRGDRHVVLAAEWSSIDQLAPALGTARQARRAALARYGAALRATGSEGRVDELAATLGHLHANRYGGLDPALETEARALARMRVLAITAQARRGHSST